MSGGPFVVDLEVERGNLLLMEPPEETILRTYAWAYFSYHADQRMKTFNFFFVGAGFLAAGISTLVREKEMAGWASPLGFVLFGLSLVFWKIDQRNRMLVRNGEAAIKYLDSLREYPACSEGPHVMRIFDRDDYNMDNSKKFPLSEGVFSYSKCLGVVYFLFALLGITFAVSCLPCFLYKS